MSRHWKPAPSHLPGWDYASIGAYGHGRKPKQSSAGRVEIERCLWIHDLQGQAKGRAVFTKRKGEWWLRDASSAVEWIRDYSIKQLPGEFSRRKLRYCWGKPKLLT